MDAKPTSFRSAFFQPLLFIGPLLAFFLMFDHNWLLFAESVVLIGLLFILFRDQEKGLFTLLILRPMADIFGYTTVIEFRSITLNLAAVLSLLVIGWSILILTERRAKMWSRPMFLPILLFFLTMCSGLVFTQSLEATTAELLRLSSMFLLYFVAFELITDRTKLKHLVTAVSLSIVIPSLVALYQFFTHTGLSFAEASNRVYGTFGHPNVFAFYLVLLLTFLGSYFFTKKHRQNPGLWWTGFGFMALLMLLTYTRGAWIGLAIVVGFLGLVRFRKALVGTIIGAAFLVMLFPAANTITTSLFDLDLTRAPIVERIIQRDSDASSLDWRYTLWREMGPKFFEKPVFGFGLGMFPVLREFQTFGFFDSTEAHNDYLRLAIETGIVGLAVYAILLLFMGYYLIKKYRELRGTPYDILPLGLLAFWPAFLAMSFFDNFLQATPVIWTLWILLAAVLNLKREE